MSAAATDRSFHLGLTATHVIDEAVDLTRASHLWGWSIRDLARSLGVSPSVVYHHVGGKDALCRAVADRVIGSLSVPDSADARWDEWFRTLLRNEGPRIADHPGVAKWMLMHGPTISSASTILERGMTLLIDAGFGADAPSAYAVLLNTAMTTIATGDDRRQHEEDGPRDHSTMMAEFERLHAASPAAMAIGNDFIGAFAAGGDTAERMRWSYYGFAIDTVIAGLSSRLTEAVASGSDRESSVADLPPSPPTPHRSERTSA